MGAWDTGPFDNDTALDALDALALMLTSWARKQLQGDPEHVRVAAEVLCTTPVIPSEDTTLWYDLTRALAAITGDREWIGAWNDEEAILSSLRAQVKRMCEVGLERGLLDEQGVLRLTRKALPTMPTIPTQTTALADQLHASRPTGRP